MKYITKEVRIGIAGIIALCVLVYGINWLKGIHMFQPSSYFYAKFQNVNGLTKSSPVFADGVRVGIVRDIFYDYTNPGNVVVEVELDTELRIPKGSSAELVSELMGGVRMNISPYDFQLQFTFASDKLAELDRKLALLYSTREGTMPLDREFGINMDFVDMPPEVAKSLYVAEITKKTAQFIPEVRVQSVEWTHGGEGQFFPKVVITSA